VLVRNLSPSRILVQALGGDDDRSWESLSVLDEVQRIARTLCGVAGEGHRFAVGDAQVQRGPNAKPATHRGDVPDGVGGGAGKVPGGFSEPVEEPGERGMVHQPGDPPDVSGRGDLVNPLGDGLVPLQRYSQVLNLDLVTAVVKLSSGITTARVKSIDPGEITD
jgi:hypothetical protein